MAIAANQNAALIKKVESTVTDLDNQILPGAIFQNHTPGSNIPTFFNPEIKYRPRTGMSRFLTPHQTIDCKTYLSKKMPEVEISGLCLPLKPQKEKCIQVL